jgi:hypothetical protein
VLELDDSERLTVDLDGHACLELIGGDNFCHVVLLAGRLVTVAHVGNHDTATAWLRAPLPTSGVPARAGHRALSRRT